MTVFQVTEKQKIQYVGDTSTENPRGRWSRHPPRQARGAHPNTSAGEAAAVNRPFNRARPAGAARRVHMRGGARRPGARRTPRTLSARVEGANEADGPLTAARAALLCPPPTVDEPGMPGDVARVVGGEVADG